MGVILEWVLSLTVGLGGIIQHPRTPHPNQIKTSLTLLGRGYRVVWGMGAAEWPLLHARRHFF